MINEQANLQMKPKLVYVKHLIHIEHTTFQFHFLSPIMNKYDQKDNVKIAQTRCYNKSLQTTTQPGTVIVNVSLSKYGEVYKSTSTSSV